MRGKKFSAGLAGVLVILFAAMFVTGAVAQQETVLGSFDGRSGAAYASLVFDASGNLYGTTARGGSGLCFYGDSVIGCGTVFEFTPTAAGGWTETVLYNFKENGRKGYYPIAGLIFDGPAISTALRFMVAPDCAPMVP